ncbi:MAG: type II toxin-antitoxin system Phd/YefM family antitoxin [Rhodomicrobium sp.]
MLVTVSEAKARFAELLKAAEAGETVVVTRHGKPVVRIEGIGERASLPRIGALKGKIWIAEDFDAPLEVFGEYTKR